MYRIFMRKKEYIYTSVAKAKSEQRNDCKIYSMSQVCNLQVVMYTLFELDMLIFCNIILFKSRSIDFIQKNTKFLQFETYICEIDLKK